MLSQNYPNLEYIVMDGGSSDDTISILKKYEGQMKWISEKDSGQANAIYKGLHIASGDVLAYLNADDLLLPNTLEKVSRKFAQNPDVMWVTGKCLIIDENDVEIRKLITTYKNLCLSIHRPALLLVTDYISQPATFGRADVFKELGPLDENLHYAMDYEYWLRLSTRYPLTILPEYLAAFRIHSQSKNTNAGHGSNYINEEKDVIAQYTRSKVMRSLHDVHRLLMTVVYSILNGSR